MMYLTESDVRRLLTRLTDRSDYVELVLTQKESLAAYKKIGATPFGSGNVSNRFEYRVGRLASSPCN